MSIREIPISTKNAKERFSPTLTLLHFIFFV
ncbi:hypothetical protein KKC_03294 [Listeria fleischmannii subsp. coloradonensis]|nr:hypothetical protein KKC_03294 [Listeria fleischmannii subsp. coloradonensis]